MYKKEKLTASMSRDRTMRSAVSPESKKRNTVLNTAERSLNFLPKSCPSSSEPYSDSASCMRRTSLPESSGDQCNDYIVIKIWLVRHAPPSIPAFFFSLRLSLFLSSCLIFPFFYLSILPIFHPPKLPPSFALG